MDLSNFKLYDVVLSADEVKRLYGMGRCDEGHHVVNFSKTRVGIGLGDGEAPQAALDVMGIPSRVAWTQNRVSQCVSKPRGLGHRVILEPRCDSPCTRSSCNKR